MNYTVLDCETDGFLDQVTKMHCLSYQKFEGKTLIEKGTITDYTEAKEFLENQELIVCHNYIRYDGPVFQKILGVKDLKNVADTLAISFYLYPIKGFKHGLEFWGERMGVAKPKVEDWKDQPLEVYINRCEEDAEINALTFHHMIDYLYRIYDKDMKAVRRMIKYLNFQMYSLRDQEEGIPLDIELAKKSKAELEIIVQEKIDNLAKNMPKTVLATAPKVMYKQNGEISAHGLKWVERIEKLGLPEGTTTIYELGNPGSNDQLKDWLINLGWVPETYKFAKSKWPKDKKALEKAKIKLEEQKAKKLISTYEIKIGECITKENAQISLPFGAGLCPSILSLIKKHPYLENLAGLYKAKHRLGIFKSFLETEKDGKVIANAHGFTNTLRMQHKVPVVNLPGVKSFYGEQIRGCLMAPDDDHIFCGSDISGLEDNTKQHYIYNYDPDYVTEMRVPGFDPHVDIGVLAGLITKEEETFFKWYNKQEDELKDNFKPTPEEKTKYKKIKGARGNAKVVNFSATYGAGPAKIAKTLECSLDFAKNLHTTYWQRNKAVKLTAADAIVKRVGGQKWLYNPISKMWLFLKSEKDRFSTLNQSSGAYVFNTWLMKVRTKLKPLGIKVLLQYHDELALICKKSQKDMVDKLLKEAMIEANKALKLNVQIQIDTQWGANYAEAH